MRYITTGSAFPFYVSLLIDSNDDYGKGLYNIMLSESLKQNITVLSQHAINSNVAYNSLRPALSEIVDAESKIIIFAGYSTEFKTVFARAKTFGLTSAGHAWLCSDGVSKNDLIVSQEYQGVLVFFPSERGISSVASPFEQTTFAQRNGFNLFDFPLNNTGTDMLPEPGQVVLTAKPFIFLAATCIDNLIFGFDKFIRENSTRTVAGLIAGFNLNR